MGKTSKVQPFLVNYFLQSSSTPRSTLQGYAKGDPDRKFDGQTSQKRKKNAQREMQQECINNLTPSMRYEKTGAANSDLHVHQACGSATEGKEEWSAAPSSTG